ncbi:hypothetical protein Syun_026192 [Stephania yunnanensis]|uniref:Large ribosomal subunit protein bL12 C-terminal domain-containing protein n=1 Tax=Stephania yunnanensis TaxID=152371 RepID=A0AAP0HVI5_9MAGN
MKPINFCQCAMVAGFMELEMRGYIFMVFLDSFLPKITDGHGEDPNSEAFKLHLPRVEDYLWMAEDGMKMQGSNRSQPWDVAFSVQAILSTNSSYISSFLSHLISSTASSPPNPPRDLSLNNHRNPVPKLDRIGDRASRPHQARAPRLRDPLPPQDGPEKLRPGNIRPRLVRLFRSAAIAGPCESKAAEKTTFDLKLEKFDDAAKIKIIKEVRSFTDLGLKEAKELVEKRTNWTNRTNRKPCMIMGDVGEIVYYNLKLRHPTLDLSIIIYDLALLIQPMLMLGISVGVAFNVIFADWMVYVIGEDGILKELELAGFQYFGGPEDGGKKIELKPGFLMEHDESVSSEFLINLFPAFTYSFLSVGAVVIFDRYFNYYKIQGGCNGGRYHQCRYKGGGEGGGGGGGEFLIIQSEASYAGVVTVKGITYVLDVHASLFVEGITVVQDSIFIVSLGLWDTADMLVLLLLMESRMFLRFLLNSLLLVEGITVVQDSIFI